jgi:hypothetical protein
VHVRDLSGVRITARPEALDRVVAEASGTLVFRFAPDEAFIADAASRDVKVDDSDAIVVDDPGFLAVDLDTAEFAALIVPHVEWVVPSSPGLAQGAVANVPAKILIDPDGGAVVLVAKAHERDFRERLELGA